MKKKEEKDEKEGGEMKTLLGHCLPDWVSVSWEPLFFKCLPSWCMSVVHFLHGLTFIVFFLLIFVLLYNRKKEIPPKKHLCDVVFLGFLPTVIAFFFGGFFWQISLTGIVLLLTIGIGGLIFHVVFSLAVMLIRVLANICTFWTKTAERMIVW